jgi:hypothetical protein
MNKALMGGGLGLLTLLGGVYYAGQMTKEEATAVTPAMEAAYKGADTANIVTLNMGRTLYMQANGGKAPEKIEDLVPAFVQSVPAEAFSKSTAVAKAYDGSGGWVMDDEGFKPNHPQVLKP